MNKGSVFVVSGPSGVGKDTVLSSLFEMMPEIKFSISSITRPMRPGEKEGDKYNFISRERFKEMIEQNLLLEYAEYVGNFYGTPRGPVDEWIHNGYNVIIEVDTQGALQIKQRMPEAVLIFILPPSFECLKNRLISRKTDAEDVIKRRIANARAEIERSRHYDYIIENLEGKAVMAAELFSQIIRAENAKVINNIQNIDEVLK